MKITLVVDDFKGGAGNIAQLLAIELCESHQVSVILTNAHSAPRYDLHDVVVYDEKISIQGKNKVKGLLEAIARMKNAINEKTNADLVISFVDNNNSIVCLSQRKTKLPIIVSERSNPLAILPKFPWDIIRRIAYRRADVVSVQFDAFRSFEKGRFSKKCRVTHNIVDAPAEKKGSVPPDHQPVSPPR